MLSPSAALLALADQRLPSGGHVHSGGVEQAITDGLVHDVHTLEAFLARRLRSTGLVTAGIASATTSMIVDDGRPLSPPVTFPARLTGLRPGSAASPTADAGSSPAASASGGQRASVVVNLERLEAEADARTPSPAQRAASRAQGRGLLRTARACWAAPSADLAWSRLGPRPHHPIVLGCAAAAAGLTPADSAMIAAYLAVSAPSTAAQRLLALDPVSVAAVTVRLGDDIERIAALAVSPRSDNDDHLDDDLATNRRPGLDVRITPFDLPDDSDPLLDLLAERHAAREERLFAS